MSRDQGVHCGGRISRTQRLSVGREGMRQRCSHVLHVGNEVPGGASNRKYMAV